MNKLGIKLNDGIISIESMDSSDSERYRQLRNREDIRKFFFTTDIISEEQQQKWYEKYKNDDSALMFSIYEISSGRYVGGIGIYDIESGKAEAGRIIVDKQLFAGKGYGARAIMLLCELAKEMEITEVYAYIYLDNISSQRSFERAGFCMSDNYGDRYKYIRLL